MPPKSLIRLSMKADNEFEQLKVLLVGETNETLNRVRSEVKHLRQELSLLTAPSRVQTLVENSLERTVQKNKETFVAILQPITLPLIRKTIQESLRDLVRSIESIVSRSFTWEGLKWRLEAWKTGKPIAEIALVHSVLYRTEFVFLIARESSQLLYQVSASNPIATNEQLFSGLLAQITDFVKEVFYSEEAQPLSTLEIDDKLVWIESGKHLIVSAVFRGQPPAEFRDVLRQIVSEIEKDFALAIQDLPSSLNQFVACEGILSEALVERLKPKSKGPKILATAIVGIVFSLLLVALIGLGMTAYGEYQHFHELKDWKDEMLSQRSKENQILSITSSNLSQLISKIENYDLVTQFDEEQLVSDLVTLHQMASSLKQSCFMMILHSPESWRLAWGIQGRLARLLEHKGILDYHFIRVRESPSLKNPLAIKVVLGNGF